MGLSFSRLSPVAVNNWWADDPTECYWMEIAVWADVGA